MLIRVLRSRTDRSQVRKCSGRGRGSSEIRSWLTYISVAWSGILEARRSPRSVHGSSQRMCGHWLTVREDHIEVKEASIPESVLLSRDGACPELEVQRALLGALGLGYKAEGVIAAPLLSISTGQFLLGESHWYCDVSLAITYRSSWRRFRQRDILVVGCSCSGCSQASVGRRGKRRGSGR